MAVDGSSDDFYFVLGVDQSASQREVRKAYLQLIVGEHPDKGGSADKFAAIQHAYAVLSDPSQRVIFDEQLERRQGHKSAGPSTSKYSTDSRNGSLSINAQGVTAYVHGQTRTINNSPGGDASAQRQEAAAGQRHREDDSDSKDTIESTSETIKELKKILLQAQQQKASAEGEGNEENLISLLAAAHIERGTVHLSVGRLHHAEFDAEEALRLCPGNVDGTELLLSIQKAFPREDSEPEADSFSSSDSDGGGDEGLA